MGFTRFYTLSSLLARGRELAIHKEIISFDLFDTLLIRRVHDPDLVKQPVARFIAAKAQQQQRNWSPQKVQKWRDSIESRHRQETGQRFADQEACYPQFMGELLREIFTDRYSEELLAEITAYELFMEQQMLVPRQLLIDWLRELTAQGKRLLVLSDVYLPADHLRQLIAHAGFLDSLEAVISSADTFLAKASGQAYVHVAEQYQLDPAHWLHIGDNPVSDGLRPAAFGVEALVLHDAGEKFRKAIVKRYINYSQGRPFWRGRALQQLMQPHEAENVPQHPLYIEGYTFIAPLIGGFIQYIAERCRTLNIRRVFFLSREGYTFKKFWELAMPALYPDGDLPVVEYLYVSRMALAGASCAYQGLVRSNADIAFLPDGNRDFRDICRIFALQVDGFHEHLARHGLAADTCLSAKHDGYAPEQQIRFGELLEDDAFQEEVRRQTREANTALLRYLEDVGFFAERQVALVDIGWLGTIQRYLYEAVRHRPDCPRFYGYLFGATRGIPYLTTPDNQIEGVIYDRHRFDMAASTVLYARDVFEEACRAPHPTLQAYVVKESGYSLQFRHSDDQIGQSELEQDRYFSPLQEGVCAAAPRYAAASALLGYSLDDYRPWFNMLMLAKLAFPKTSEVCTIRHKHHLDDFFGSHQPKIRPKIQDSGLWSQSPRRLRFSPWLRLRLFLRHLRERIKE